MGTCFGLDKVGREGTGWEMTGWSDRTIFDAYSLSIETEAQNAMRSER